MNIVVEANELDLDILKFAEAALVENPLGGESGWVYYSDLLVRFKNVVAFSEKIQRLVDSGLLEHSEYAPLNSDQYRITPEGRSIVHKRIIMEPTGFIFEFDFHSRMMKACDYFATLPGASDDVIEAVRRLADDAHSELERIREFVAAHDNALKRPLADDEPLNPTPAEAVRTTLQGYSMLKAVLDGLIWNLRQQPEVKDAAPQAAPAMLLQRVITDLRQKLQWKERDRWQLESRLAAITQMANAAADGSMASHSEWRGVLRMIAGFAKLPVRGHVDTAFPPSPEDVGEIPF